MLVTNASIPASIAIIFCDNPAATRAYLSLAPQFSSASDVSHLQKATRVVVAFDFRYYELRSFYEEAVAITSPAGHSGCTARRICVRRNTTNYVAICGLFAP